MKVYLIIKYKIFLEIFHQIFIIIKIGVISFRTELIYFKNDKTYTFMIFDWAILIPLSMSYVNFSFF